MLAVAVAAHDAGTLDRVLVATLALLALASFETVAPLPAAARELAGTLAAGRRVLELTAREPAVRDPERPAAAPRPPVTVALEGVTARYPGAATPALRRLDLRLEPGERVALVGPSGAGKTTVTNLLLRFLDPEEGRVTLAGRDLRDYPAGGRPPHVRARGPGRARVRLDDPREPPARPAAGDRRRAATRRWRQAHLADWVASLPDGLDTLVGEDGRRLSGGQRQRLVLARALLADAPVLLLDEPTAHLDPPTAERSSGDVLDAATGKSVLLITHRPEGLDLVDRVVTLSA